MKIRIYKDLSRWQKMMQNVTSPAGLLFHQILNYPNSLMRSKKLIIELLNTWHNLIEETFKSGIGMN